MKMIRKSNVSTMMMILCNDILLIASKPTRFISGKLLAVYPLLDLKVTVNPQSNSALENEFPHRILISHPSKVYGTVIGGDALCILKKEVCLYI